MIINLASTPPAEQQALLQGLIIPRPIALASTMAADGTINLSPFSFFNLFGVNPPTVVFSPSRRVRDNTRKHTLENLEEVPEVVIHLVNYNMVQQTSLASTEYPRGVNEFEKAGFTAVKSERVRPPRVAEALAALECQVKQIIPLGDSGGAGNLVICEVLVVHVEDKVFRDGRVDPLQLDAVARCGGDWYCRLVPEALFQVPKPLATRGIGIDALPEAIRRSHILTGNDLGILGNMEALPVPMPDEDFQQLLHTTSSRELHQIAQELIRAGEAQKALSLLLREN